MIHFLRIFIIFSLFILASCSDSDFKLIPPGNVNVTPTASAGNGVSANEGSVVTLNASNSSDSDGTIASFAWRQTSGTTVTLQNANTAMASFTAPQVNADVVLTFEVTVTDNDGAAATDTVNVTVQNVVVNAAPVASAGADRAVNERTTVTLDGRASNDPDAAAGAANNGIASYSWTQTAGTTVVLTGANTAQPSFTAPEVATAGETLTFNLTVRDANNASGSDSINITVQNVNRPPVAAAGMDASAVSGSTVMLDGRSSTDPDGTVSTFAWTQTGGSPTVTIANANTAQASFTAPTVTANTPLTFTLTVTDNMTLSDSDDVVITVTPAAPTSVTISGKVTFDHFPIDLPDGVDYSSLSQLPVRDVVVQAVDGMTVLATTNTDTAGDYSLTVPTNQNLIIRVQARALSTTAPVLDFKVVDNTNMQAPYVMDSASRNSGTSNATLNLNAASGYGGSANAAGAGRVYTGTRVAAPFAILDAIYQGYTAIRLAQPSVDFPPLTINWSPDNVPARGDLTTGMIGTSFYNDSNLYILGADGNDTDEYDDHVILHEFGHYFEDKLSRSDSIGGPHGDGDVLDPRVAFGEGFGNALSGILTNDPSYRDSSGANQADASEINVEANPTTNQGWFSEASIQSILYDLFDSTQDGAADTVSLGFTPLYNVFANEQKATDAFTTVFSFVNALKANNPEAAAGIDAILAAQSIDTVNNDFGDGETNNAGNANDVLPVHTQLTIGAASNVCSISAFGVENKLSVHRYLRFNAPVAGSYTVTVTGTSGSSQDAAFELFRRGQSIVSVDSNNPGFSETNTQNLVAGVHVLDVFDFENNNDSGAGAGRNCFDVTVTQN